MPATPGASIFRAIRLLYGAMFVLIATCALAAYYFWPGLLAWIFLALGVLALAGGIAFSQLLARFRMILWILPYLAKGKLGAKGTLRAPTPDDDAGRGPGSPRG